MSYVDVPTSSRHELIRLASGLPWPGGEEPDVGGGIILADETNGFATDFQHPVDAERVALKAADAVTYYGLDAFWLNVAGNGAASPKLVYDSAGVLVWAPHNMVLQSADFTNASWAKTGTLNETAHTLTDNDAATVEFVAQSVTVIAGAQYTVSTWFLKDAVTSRFAGVALVSTNQIGTQINTSTGAIVNDINTITGTAVVEDTGTHWLLKQTITAVSTSVAVRVYPARDLVFGGTSGGNVAAVGTVTIDRMQFNRGAVPTAYLPTTTARYGLAVDYHPLTHALRGLLVEPAATNLVLRSQEFDNAAWTKGLATVGANAVAAPNGVLEADALIPNAGAVLPYVSQNNVVTAATAYTASVYVKNGTLGTTWFQIALISTTTWRCWFNLSTGVKGSSLNSPTSYNITNVGNGWYRVDMTVTAGTTNMVWYMITSLADGDFTNNITGNGTSPSFYAWGAQLETGTIATSPIPTFAATATRTGDCAKIVPASINVSATAGSWWVEVEVRRYTGPTDAFVSYTTLTPLFISHVNQFGFYDGAIFYSNASGGSTLGVHKLASAFATADRALSADGNAPTLNTTAGAPLLTPPPFFGLGSNPTSGGANFCTAWIRKVKYLPRRQSNAELQTSTVL